MSATEGIFSQLIVDFVILADINQKHLFLFVRFIILFIAYWLKPFV